MKNIESPLKLFCDNKLSVMYCNNNRSCSKSKHIEIKFLLVKGKSSRSLNVYRAYLYKLHDCRSEKDPKYQCGQARNETLSVDLDALGMRHEFVS